MNTGSSVTLDGSGSSLAGASDALASPAFAIPPSFAAPRIESSLSLPSLVFFFKAGFSSLTKTFSVVLYDGTEISAASLV